MTISEIFQKIKAEGITQCREHTWEDAHGAVECRDLEDIKKASTFGALYHAELKGWITSEEIKPMVKQMKQFAEEKFGCKFIGVVEKIDEDWTFEMLEEFHY